MWVIVKNQFWLQVYPNSWRAVYILLVFFDWFLKSDDKEIIDASRAALDDEEAYKGEDEEEEDNTLSKIQGLPAELLLHIFSHLNPLDLSQCSMVCTRWAGLARDPSIWKHLYPSQWTKGKGLRG